MHPRIYDSFLSDHLSRYRQMAFITGPRQVGKTTVSRQQGTSYFDWDNQDDRRKILEGPSAFATHLGLDQLRKESPVAVLDELHKYGRWKSFLKGFFDTYEKRVRIVVTGSSRLDVYRRGGDSLSGRYFLYHMHPFSVAEGIRQDLPESPIRPPAPMNEKDFTALLEHGGYPEPFLKRDGRFSTRWRRLRRDQLLREEVRDLTRIQELGQVEVFGALLRDRSGAQLIFTNLANVVQVSVDTARRWVHTFSSLFLGFLVRPWFKNVTRSLRREPKWFLRDWSDVDDPGSRTETFIACHLLKAVEGWQDLGLGEFELRYLRDKSKQEVDFLVVKNRKPWFLVEAKKRDSRLSPSLEYFQKQIKAEHAFQVVLDLDYIDADCFQHREPIVVPARTLLSQLL